ncbi:MAG: hypothetical protein U0M00_01180 [Clostridia bacterium]|nr:hypothetical protein [Clostridia bacterium]
MENASKALLMAGTILIAMLILAIGVYLASSFSQTSDTYYRRWSTEQVQQYNDQITRNFIIEDGTTYVTAQGIITIRNLIKMSKYDEVTVLENNAGNSIVTPNEDLLKNSFDADGNLNKYRVIKTERENETGLITKIKVSYP